MVIDFRKKDIEIMPLKINDKIIEQVSTYKYLGVTIGEKLHWSDHINNIKLKANKRLYFVKKLGLFKIDRPLFTLFYKSVIENVLSFCDYIILLGREQFEGRPSESRRNN